jgi:hypothetical protein
MVWHFVRHPVYCFFTWYVFWNPTGPFCTRVRKKCLKHVSAKTYTNRLTHENCKRVTTRNPTAQLTNEQSRDISSHRWSCELYFLALNIFICFTIQLNENWKIGIKAPFWLQLSLLIEPWKKCPKIISKIWVQNVPRSVQVSFFFCPVIQGLIS